MIISSFLLLFVVSSIFCTWTDSDGLRCDDNNNNNVKITNKYVDFLKHFENGLKIIHGSDMIRNAFRLNKNSYLSMTTSDIFPEGFPSQFSFSCTFRDYQSMKNSSWNLLNIDDFIGDTQFSLKILPFDNIIELYIQHLKLLKFENIPFYQNDWNKIDLSFQSNNVTLFINCQIQQTKLIESIPMLDIDGDITICNNAFIDLQSMSLDCDATRPTREKCDEIIRMPPKIINKKIEIVKECCEPKPLDKKEIKSLIFDVLNDNLDYFAVYFRGSPGKSGLSITGPPGPQGPKGSIGPKGDTGTCLKGEKGEKGMAGIPGKSIPIRDGGICFNNKCQNNLMDLKNLFYHNKKQQYKNNII